MASAVAATAPLSEHEHLRRAVIASTVGTAIEWYDFFLYGVVTATVFAKLYFRNEDPLSARNPARGARRASNLPTIQKPRPGDACGFTWPHRLIGNRAGSRLSAGRAGWFNTFRPMSVRCQALTPGH
jgi:hypothetical protein